MEALEAAETREVGEAWRPGGLEAGEVGEAGEAYQSRAPHLLLSDAPLWLKTPPGSDV